MKLNKNGWSGKEMIILSTILLSFLLVAIFFIIRLYNGLNKDDLIPTSSTENYTYDEIEEYLLEAGLDYYNEYYNQEDVEITVDKLKKHKFITSTKLKAKSESKACDGYVSINQGYANAYINCGHYKTSGYEE